ncbi:acyl-CoA dehydrogenase [Rhodococcus sp. PAMC28707]|uniref:acyl-CoA dehydrogenase family protein n=1 Tax=unclassified Rhodococcus (in: high G+C Gram-positive bacteria) TaxID=192944 RepID=UPI00109E25EE|nr:MULTISPECIES: acyl-CoA dehydrogenase family protein [unclassified Rhodococcus (in: high G+C Gram-positive bacteria)]QCB50032.1 acyl-CoA dehydrogenase [Rhodococcus sp. PAMC28705]QCB58273.1 acyl-CoA dehydrogenase [Rhodococcus sp. PAMC28707]
MGTAQYRSSWIDDDIVALKDMATKFFEAELLPNQERFADQKSVDRDVWNKAGNLGLLCASIPEQYGGGGGTYAHDFAIFDAQYRLGDTSFGNMVHSGIVAHYILAYGSEEQKQRWLPKMASGELVGAIAMSEPGAGSDLKMLRTNAVHDGDEYVINGAKTFISNGKHADLVIVAAKTDLSAGAKGVSLIVVETADVDGYRVGRVLDKIGMKGQDTAELFFEDVRVPAENLLGDEGAGFGYLMKQLPHERLVIGVCAAAATEAAVAITVQYTKDRSAFGGPLFDMQNTRFQLADCATLARVSRVFVDNCIERHLRGELDSTTASMAKAYTTDVQGRVVDKCLQLFGGYGYMAEYQIARMYADARVQRIYGGSNEVMKDLIARSL